MCYGSSIAFAEENKFEHIKQGVAFCPSEIDMRNLSRLITHVEKECRNRVWNGLASCAQHTVVSDLHASDLEVAGEIRCIAWPHFEEEHRIISRNMIIPPLLFLLQSIFIDITPVRTIGDDPDRAFLCIFNELFRHLIQFHSLNP